MKIRASRCAVDTDVNTCGLSPADETSIKPTIRDDELPKQKQFFNQHSQEQSIDTVSISLGQGPYVNSFLVYSYRD